MKSIIDVKNLSFRYKESQEYYDVKDITFHVKRGEWLSIVGIMVVVNQRRFA